MISLLSHLPGQVRVVERKLSELGEVRGIVAEAFSEVIEATHALLSHLSTASVRTAGVERGRQDLLRSKDTEQSPAISSLLVTSYCCDCENAARQCQCWVNWKLFAPAPG